MAGALYVDNDPHVCRWARNLIAAGLAPAGDVLERDIREVRGSDVESYGECHFFCGILGWPLALRLAGWPYGREVWTASLPCQPFSVAGKRRGESDDRHLWPAFFRLVGERRPATLLGEQSASPDGLRWLDGVFADLEGIGYSCGAADLPAAGVSAPHVRQRLFWLGVSPGERDGPAALGGGARPGAAPGRERGAGGSGAAGPARPWDAYGVDECSDGRRRRVEPGAQCLVDGVPYRLASGLAGKSGSRIAALRGFGNAIVPQVGALFVRAYLEATAG